MRRVVNPHVVFAILIALGVVWTAVWAIVLLRSRRQIPFATIEGRLRRLQLVLFASFLVVGATVFVAMLRWLPYRNIRFAGLGRPQVSVEATGIQWTWMLSGPRIPADVPVEFVVRAIEAAAR